MASSQEMKLRNIGLMQAECGYDVTIVCCSDDMQSAYWNERLNAARGRVIPSSSTAVAVDEDWEGGAGNFLGTLYAWQKACQALSAQGRDLAAELEAGASVALFHTAGKGTRMAPVPGGENNNKPGVKLPVPGGISILEGVIRQTGAYAASRKGRLSVFWGDQIFVPSVDAAYSANHHVDIACALGPMPTAEEWSAKGLEKYGLIAATAENSVAAMLEKVSHEVAQEQLAPFSNVDRVGFSLGSFSLSAPILKALVEGFAPELAAKEGKMDSDPHVWMAMTLEAEAYANLMVQKGLFDKDGGMAHHARVASIIAGFDMSSGGLTGGMFGAVTVGTECSWWDYGLLALYIRNSLLLTLDTSDAQLARAFFGISEEGRVTATCALGDCQVDDASVVSATEVRSGSIANSSVMGVCAVEVSLDGAVVVNTSAKKIVAAKGALAYNILDNSEEGIVLNENEVRVGVFTGNDEKPYFEMRSKWDEFDGGKVFKTPVCGNELSFEGVYKQNQGVDVLKCSAASAAARAALAKELGL